MKKILRSIIALGLLLPAFAATMAQAAPTAKLGFGTTTVVFAPSFLEAATSLGVQINRINPAVLRAKGDDTLAKFPISAGSLDLATLKSEIIHRGGLRLSAGGTVVDLTDYIIDTTGTPVLTGLVKVNGSVVTRANLFNLALPDIATPLQLPKSGQVVIGDVQVTLTADAASLLNSTYHVSAFTENLEIGTATIRARR